GVPVAGKVQRPGHLLGRLAAGAVVGHGEGGGNAVRRKEQIAPACFQLPVEVQGKGSVAFHQFCLHRLIIREVCQVQRTGSGVVCLLLALATARERHGYPQGTNEQKWNDLTHDYSFPQDPKMEQVPGATYKKPVGANYSPVRQVSPSSEPGGNSAKS